MNLSERECRGNAEVVRGETETGVVWLTGADRHGIGKATPVARDRGLRAR